METTVRADDGRTLAVEEAGDPGGLPVLAQLGTPSSRHLSGRHAEDATARGLRLISYDRPGNVPYRCEDLILGERPHGGAATTR
jgi:hypothetical protein